MSEFAPGAVLDLTEELLRIPSVTGDESAIADFVEQFGRGLDAATVVRASNSVLIANRALDPSRRTVMLIGHTDTVPQLDDNPVRRDAGRLYGLGASDMKAADAAILAALRQDVATPARHNVVGVLYACEEGPFDDNEMPLLMAAARPWFEACDLAICMEPTDLRVELGCLGTSHATVTFAGQRAHSARPWQGRNAIHAAADFLSRLRDRPTTEHTFAGLTFVESMSATMVESRGARNVIPDRCAINVNYRFAPGRDEAGVRAELDTMVAGEASWELTDFCPAGEVCADNALLAELRAVAGEPEVCAKQAWTDVGRLSREGIDAVNWGPGAVSQAHQAGEWVEVAAVERCVTALRGWLFD